MLGIFKAWISSMICLGVFVTIIQLIIPKANIKKYIYTLIGIVSIFTIIGPIINILNTDEIKESVSQVLSNISDTASITKLDTKKYDEVKEEAVKNSFIDSFVNDIKEKITLKGIKINDVDVLLGNNYDINKVEVSIQGDQSSLMGVNAVNEISKYINSEYDIEYSKIVVIEE